MPVIKFYIISCSADVDCPEPIFFIWCDKYGMPWTRDEAETHIVQCQKETKCEHCNAAIHHINLVRTRAVGVKYDEDFSRKLAGKKKEKK